jgi:signal transduction histidine kinase
MGEPSRAEDDALVVPHALDIAAVEAPIALCTASGELLGATRPALLLLKRTSHIGELPESVPLDLWRLLERTATGEAVEWRGNAAPHEVLGCSRYPVAPGSFLLLMREVASKRLAQAELLQKQQQAVLERLVSSITRDIRGSVASVVYSADFLKVSGGHLAERVLSETVKDIAKASSSLQQTLDALLDYAQLGPSVSVTVSLRDVLNRALGSLRTHYREGAHRVRMDVAPRAESVRGNPLIIEQILVSLLLNSVEASAAPRCVIITAFPALRPFSTNTSGPLHVCIRVWDDGPGIAPAHPRRVVDHFFSTKQGSAGLGLSLARQAAERMEGTLELTDDDTGTCFSLYLPVAGEQP